MYNYQKNYLMEINQLELKNKKILELGCSNGVMVRELAKKEPDKIIGIDINIEDIVLSENAILMRMDASNLEFPDNYFDYVFSVATFEHVTDPRKVLDEAWRVLKPGGIFFCRFSPIWTAINGHHYKIWEYNNNIMLPPWGHLIFNYNDMFKYLKEIYSEDDALSACIYIYRSNEINRIKYREYIEIFKATRFKQFQYERIIKEKSKNYLSEKMRFLLKIYTEEELLTSGFILKGRK